MQTLDYWQPNQGEEAKDLDRALKKMPPWSLSASPPTGSTNFQSTT
jgi:hypothetical protein